MTIITPAMQNAVIPEEDENDLTPEQKAGIDKLKNQTPASGRSTLDEVREEQ